MSLANPLDGQIVRSHQSPAQRGTVAIIILNWNGRDDTIECLRSLAGLEYPYHKVIVVDNGSRDDSVSALRRLFPQVDLIETRANLGFAAGNNVGIARALSLNFDYIFLLNNDTTVDPRILDQFLDASERYPAAGVFGAKIYYYDDPHRLWYAGARWLPDQAEFEHVGGTVLDNGRDYEVTQPTAYACGCALFARSAVARDIGMLNPAFFILWEEADWCYRAGRKGFGTLFIPGAKVWHKVSSTFQGGWRQTNYQYYFWRNRLLFIERNLPRREALRLLRRVVWGQLTSEWRIARDPSQSRPERLAARAGLYGARDYLLRRFGRGPDWIYQRAAQD